MTTIDEPVQPSCVFCAIVSGQAEASVVHEDEDAVAFMALHPVAPGHLLVIPKVHAAGLDDLDPAGGAHVWTVGHRLSHALRRSCLPCDGVNVLVCDGEAAFQTVFHLHLHVIPRTVDDGWTLTHVQAPERERALLDADARAIRDALTSAG